MCRLEKYDLEGCLRIDRLVWFKIKRNFLFFSFISQDRPYKQYKTVRWDTIIKFEALLSASNGCEHRLPIHSRLDVRRRTVFLGKHGRSTRDLILKIMSSSRFYELLSIYLRRDNETNHGSPSSTKNIRGCISSA